MEEGKNVDVICLDFASAFDKVDHGITGKLGQWLYNFLTGRSQSVVVNGIPTEPSSVRIRNKNKKIRKMTTMSR